MSFNITVEGGKSVRLPTKGKYCDRDIIVTATGGGGGGSGDKEWFNDGDTHIWISLPEVRTSPMLGVCINGTATVDWGDSTEPDVLTGTNITTVKWTPNHEYAEPGDYVIRLTVNGTAGISGASQGANILVNSSSASDNRNHVYRTAIKKIEIGNGISISSYAFSNCYSLASIKIPYGVTSLGGNAFSGCCSLESVVIPDSITSIGSYLFYECYSLASAVIPDGLNIIEVRAFQRCQSLTHIIIPNSVHTVSNYAFANCFSLRFCDFSSHTSVPKLSSTGAFNSISPDLEIRVPAALYDEWIAATNWSTFASQIVAV